MTVRARFITVETLEERMKVFEDKYGVPSERFVDAFKDENGELVETQDFLDWSSLRTCWRVATGELPTVPPLNRRITRGGPPTPNMPKPQDPQ